MPSTTHRPRARAPRTRVRKRDRPFKDLPDTEFEGEEEGDEPRNNDDEGYISIGAVDTTNEGLARSKKRKRDDEAAAATINHDGDGDVKMVEGEGQAGKKTKKVKKDGENTQQVHNEAYSNLLKTAKNKKRKERRKNAAAKARSGGEDENGGEVEATGDGDGGDEEKRGGGGNNEAVKDGGRKDNRFIVFVGNLPYTTTQATLTAHLSAVKPTAVRVATYKPGEKPKSRGYKPKKSESTEGATEQMCKGYAFVEFPDAGRMKSCLSLFHHSEFEGRKINVELTAGGGGKSNERKERVRAKNESLNEERKKRFEEDRRKKIERGEKVEEPVEEEVDDGIHPSRRRRVRR